MSGQGIRDMQLFVDTSFVHNGLRSNMRLSFQNGTSYFFHWGAILGKRDRFGNQILFEYGSNGLARIINSDDSVISFHHQIIGNNKTTTITSPDGSSFVINMSRVPSWHGDNNGFQVNSIRNQVNAVTTFTHAHNNFAFHWLYSAENPYGFSHHNSILLLEQVTYPSGAQLHFRYESFMSLLGRHGHRQVHRVRYRFLYNPTAPANERVIQFTEFHYH